MKALKILQIFVIAALASAPVENAIAGGTSVWQPPLQTKQQKQNQSKAAPNTKKTKPFRYVPGTAIINYFYRSHAEGGRINLEKVTGGAVNDRAVWRKGMRFDFGKMKSPRPINTIKIVSYVYVSQDGIWSILLKGRACIAGLTIDDHQIIRGGWVQGDAFEGAIYENSVRNFERSASVDFAKGWHRVELTALSTNYEQLEEDRHITLYMLSPTGLHRQLVGPQQTFLRVKNQPSKQAKAGVTQ